MVQGSKKKKTPPPPDFAGVIELRIWDGEAHRLRERTFSLAVPHSMWDLSSPTRDCTHAPNWKLGVLLRLLLNGLPGKSLENELKVPGGKDSKGVWDGHVHTCYI